MGWHDQDVLIPDHLTQLAILTASVHKDRDGSPYAYGVWYLVNKGTGKILTPAQLKQVYRKYPKWHVYFVVLSWGVYSDLIAHWTERGHRDHLAWQAQLALHVLLPR